MQKIIDAAITIMLVIAACSYQDKVLAQDEKDLTRKRSCPPIQLIVEEPCGVARVSWPVTSGVCFPKGVIFSVNELKLMSSSGQETPCQFKSLATWPDKSIRWALLDFQTSIAANAKQGFTLRGGSDVTRAVYKSALEVISSEDSVSISTGVMRVNVGGRGGFVNQVAIQNTNLLGNSFFEGAFFISKGIAHSSGLSRPTNVTIEDSGPMRVTARIKGKHKSDKNTQLLNYDIRLDFYANLPWFKASYTVENFESAVPLEKMWFTGDKRALDTAINIADTLCRLAGTEDTQSYERAIGWPVIACMAVYEATWNKKYLNAAKTMVDFAIKSQDQKRGCWYFIQEEGGQSVFTSSMWMMCSILCEGIYRYWVYDPRPEVATCLTRAIDFFIDNAWDAKKGMNPEYIMWDKITKKEVRRYAPTIPMMLYSSGIARAYEVSKNRKYLILGEQFLSRAMTAFFPSSGKQITQQLRNTPYLLYWLDQGK